MNFLTSTEIATLKTLRATYITVDADLQELKDFFAKYSIALSLDKTENQERIMSIALLPTTCETNAKLLKIMTTAKAYDFNAAIKAISDKAFTFQYDRNFDSTQFVLNNSFDFSPYTVDKFGTVSQTLALNVIFGTPRV